MNEVVLIVDDTPTNLEVLVSFVAHLGYKTLVAEDGESALEQISLIKPDIILLDVMMPRLDGFETCRRLKENPDTKDIPVLFMTALGNIDNKLRGFEVGGVDYLTKPVQKEEVIARLTTHLTIVRQQRELQSMIEQRSRFMRMAAHDLRNPLTVMTGWTDLGLVTVESEDVRKMFQRIRRSVDQMSNIIEDFLALNVLQHKNRDQAGRFDFQAMIEQVISQQNFAATTKGIKIDLKKSDSPVFVWGSGVHTHQILTNYVSNAIKYSPLHTTVTLTLVPQENRWRLTVQDQGPGVHPRERNNLFVEFAKISNKPTGGETSTGLGLAIVKMLAEAQQGNVGVDFPEGGGSHFWVELPAAQETLG